MCCSEMPTLTKRSGWARSKSTVWLENLRSAVRTTMSGSSSPIAASTLPETAEVESSSIPARSQLLPLGTGAKSIPSSSATLIDLLGRGGRALGRQVADVPGARKLHIGDPFSLDGAGDDALRLRPGGGGQRRGGGEDRRRVVAVDLDHVPAEGFEAAGDRLDRVGLLGGPVEAHLVGVDDRADVAEAEVGRRAGRFPDLALVQLLVAEQDPDPGLVVAAHPRRLRHPDPDREAVAERAGGAVDAGDAAHVGVVAERAAEPRVGVEPVGREVAAFGEQGVEADGDVTLGEDQPVALGPLWILGDPHHAGVEGREDLGTGEDARVVAAARDPDQPDRLSADRRGPLPNLVDAVNDTLLR